MSRHFYWPFLHFSMLMPFFKMDFFNFLQKLVDGSLKQQVRFCLIFTLDFLPEKETSADSDLFSK